MNEPQTPDEHRHHHRKDSLKESLQPLVEAIKEFSHKKEKTSCGRAFIDGFYTLLRVFGILLFCAIAIDTGIQIRKQCHTQTILIEPFAVSPDLEKLGYSSKVVAILLVDKCEVIINSTKSGVDLGTFYRTDDESYLDIDVPETHFSLKTFANYVTERLGHHPTRITGEFIGQTNQLALTMRIDPVSSTIPKMVGTLGNLDQLLDTATTNILKQTHPFDLACHLYDQGETNQAYEMIQQCIIEIKPKYVMGHQALGNSKLLINDLAGGIADLDKAIELNPQGFEAYENRAVARSRLNDYAGAKADFNKAIELNPQFAESYDNRGTVKLNSTDFIGAISDYTMAIELDPNRAVSLCAKPCR